MFEESYGWMILLFLSFLLTAVIGFQGAEMSRGLEENIKMGVGHKSLHFLAVASVRIGGFDAREALQVPQLQLPALNFGSFGFLKVTKLGSVSAV